MEGGQDLLVPKDQGLAVPQGGGVVRQPHFSLLPPLASAGEDWHCELLEARPFGHLPREGALVVQTWQWWEGSKCRRGEATGEDPAEKCLQDAGCSHPPPPWPYGPSACCQVLLVGRRGARGPARHAASSSCPHGRLPGPLLVPSQGQVGAHCPRWARPGPEGWLSSFSSVLAGGGAPGPGAGGSVVLGPLCRAPRSLRRQSQKREVSSPPPLPRRPSCSRPASFSSHPPPSARVYDNRAMLHRQPPARVRQGTPALRSAPASTSRARTLRLRRGRRTRRLPRPPRPGARPQPLSSLLLRTPPATP